MGMQDVCVVTTSHLLCACGGRRCRVPHVVNYTSCGVQGIQLCEFSSPPVPNTYRKNLKHWTGVNARIPGHNEPLDTTLWFRLFQKGFTYNIELGDGKLSIIPVSA